MSGSSMYPHRIRLRGPWECQPVAGLAESQLPLPAPCRMTLPCRWADGGLPGFAGRARMSRRFGYPGRIDAHERVWLTCAGLSDRATVSLNGQPLGECAGPWEHEITELLQPRNQVCFEIEGNAADGGLWGEVALEVRCTAYLRGVRVWLDPPGQVHAAGEVVGQADRPLDLYIVVGRSPAAYSSVMPQPQGTPFRLTIPALPEGRDLAEAEQPFPVTIELVNGAVVWYSWEQLCPLNPDSNPL